MSTAAQCSALRAWWGKKPLLFRAIHRTGRKIAGFVKDLKLLYFPLTLVSPQSTMVWPEAQQKREGNSRRQTPTHVTKMCQNSLKGAENYVTGLKRDKQGKSLKSKG